MKDTIKPKAFISYAHADGKNNVKNFWITLKSYLDSDTQKWDKWDDTEIKAGEEWDNTIQDALNNSCNCCLLLISDLFGKSSYIINDEWPKTLKRYKQEGILFFPIVFGVLESELAGLPKDLNSFQIYYPSVADLYKIPPTNILHPDKVQLCYEDIDNDAAKKRFASKLASQINTRFDEYIRMREEKVILDDNKKQAFHSIKNLLTTSLNKIEKLSKSDEIITGEATGYTDLDEQTSGFHGGDLVIVAGRPAMGKTTFSMNIAEHVVLNKEKKAVAIFSMEMPAEQLLLRMLASTGRVPLTDIRTGKIREEDWPRVGMSVKSLAQAKLFIDDTPTLSPSKIRTKTQHLAREHNGISLVVIDYLQLIKIGKKTDNRADEVSEISRSLKSLAKELDCPIIVISQLNRSLEKRPNKRPLVSDLGESGAIEQDADIIIFIYRDEVYNPDSLDKGMAEIIVGKQRNGPIGMTRLTFTAKYNRFDNYSPFI